jgi:hypothetical protein
MGIQFDISNAEAAYDERLGANLKGARRRQAMARKKVQRILDDKPKGDLINQPAHYAVMTCSCGKNIEARDIINAIIKPMSGMFAHDIACGLKYILRLGKKDDVKQELGKSLKYLGWARERAELEQFKRGEITEAELTYPLSHYLDGT